MNEESKPSSEWEQRKSVYVRQTGKEKVYNTAEDYCPELYIIFICLYIRRKIAFLFLFTSEK